MWCPASSQLKWTKGQVRGQKSFLSWLTLSIAWFLHACFHKSIYSLHFYGCKKGLQLILVVVHSVMSNSLWPHGLQHTRHACPSPSPRACSNSCPLSQWCHPTISSSVIPLSSCFQFFQASGSFQMSQLFSSGGQSIGTSASVLSMYIQDWFPLRLTGWISSLSKGLSRVFSNTTVQKHQFLSTQPSLWSSSHTCTWLLENHSFD